MSNHPKDACPDCGHPKLVTAERCRTCAGRQRRTAQHGTDSRYVQHRRDGEDACEPCKRAHAVAVERNRRAQQAARRRARQLAKAARRRCPACGGVKSARAETCRACSGGGRRRTATHGTEGGYYRHTRTPDPDNGWPSTACDACLAAHAAATRERSGRRPPRRRPPAPREPEPKFRRCPDCGTPISNRSTRCRSCASRTSNNPVRWQRVGLIWKEAS